MQNDKTVLYEQSGDIQDAGLYIWDHSGEMRYHHLSDNEMVGRKYDGSTAAIQLDSTITSRRHGEFTLLAGHYCYRDTGSLNGTFINGEKLGNGIVAKKLEHGDVLRIDQANLKYTHEQAVLMIYSLSAEPVVWKTVPLTESTGDIKIGRDSGGVSLHDTMVSQNHATFHRGMNSWSVVDHDSTNGVYVNNQRIQQPTELHRLDVVRIANTTFLFLGDKLLYNGTEEKKAEATEGSLVIHIAERSVKKLLKKKILLQNIDMTIQPGEMVLILGGSGAGKTTFLNAVMGYEKAEGSISHGDVDIYKDYAQMKYKIGFVPQQDLLREDDTVYMTLDNAARMKMSRHTTKAEREARIAEVLELLGLQREQKSLVNKLSGGQKKRLSIAVEFIANPSLFFLDEPDSGLDGIMAISLMKNLRIIADDGKIVMIITHAPDRVAEMFDKVVVLAKSSVTNSGHLAFFGSIPEAKSFFETDTLEGIVRRINRPDEGGDGRSDEFIEKYKTYHAQ